jgi:hypothetical protein
MPFGPYVAGNKTTNYKRFSRDKINLIRSLDLLVIDEISMVRADTMDGIDEVLRKYRDHEKPFGGIQLLMIGDLHQLSPVVKDDDWKILKDFYPNLYFFSSRALQKTDPVNIELKHIYRQADTTFIDLLNNVRNNRINEKLLAQLNQRHIPNFKPGNDEGYITLTTHNKLAQDINEVKLAEISEPAHTFTAVVHDNFPEYNYPTVFQLELKPGAQVMFVKNDPSRDRRFYNGKIGKVVKFQKDIIYVKCPGDLHEILVERLTWENIQYELNTTTKEVEEKTIGSFTQYPLKLAWAITIHKSQGLTFEKAIIDANAAFAHGQVYVALSRCKSFEGLVLSSAISFNSVKTDGTVATYTKNVNDNPPTEQHLAVSKIVYQQSLIYELFDFKLIKANFFQCKKVAEENYTAFSDGIINELNAIRSVAEKEIYQVSYNFHRYLSGAFDPDVVPEDSAALQEKIKKACVYFYDKISVFQTAIKKIMIETDNKAVRLSITDAINSLQKELFIKLALFKLCIDGFSTLTYLRAKANAEIDFSEAKNMYQTARTESRKATHPLLYTNLKTWRDTLAEKTNLPVYMILPHRSLLELVRVLPANLKQLESIKGMGKVKVKQYGEAIIGIINTFCDQHNVQRSAAVESVKEIKPDTKKLSFDLFKQGKTVQEIAEVRMLTTGTIEGHLAYFIKEGNISVFDIVSKHKVDRIMAYLTENPEAAISESKTALGEDISYGELRAVKNHLEFLMSATNSVMEETLVVPETGI